MASNGHASKVAGLRYYLLFLVVVSLSLFAWLVWPTPWKYATEYYQAKGDREFYPEETRVNRFTGAKQTRMDSGEWIDGVIQH